VKALKRKLGEKDEEVSSSRNKINNEEKFESESEVNILKRKLDEKDEDLSKMKVLLQHMKDKIECPVCLELPRNGPVPVCPNGHFVCSTCKKDSCPSCRTFMGTGKSLLASIVLENIEHKCRFGDCNENFHPEALKKHEAGCSQRTVNCPDANCSMKVPLSNLVDHLKSSEKCCAEDLAPLKPLENWNKRNYNKLEGECTRMHWKMHIYSFYEKIFAVFPVKSEGQFFFVIVMFASEIECSKFKFEMIVHVSGRPLDPKTEPIKFQGSPLSIDVKKEDLNYYCCSGRFMAKLMKESTLGNSFSLSFKILKRESI